MAAPAGPYVYIEGSYLYGLISPDGLTVLSSLRKPWSYSEACQMFVECSKDEVISIFLVIRRGPGYFGRIHNCVSPLVHIISYSLITSV